MTALTAIFWVAIAILFYTYLGYGILLYLLVRIKELFAPQQRYELPEELPEVTLFIAAYNEQEILEEKMRNCRALNYPAERLRIVWVTDGTTDDTNRRLLAYPEATVYFTPQRRGKTAALNRGMQFVTTPYVVFTDANTMLNADAIREIVRCFSDPKTGCVAGEKRIAQRGTQTAAATEGIYWRYESKLKEWDDRLHSAIGAAGELFAVRRDLFRAMPEDTLLDDFILSMGIAMQGYKIAYCKAAYAQEEASADMNEEGKRKVRIAAGGLQAIARLRPLLNPLRYGVLGWQYLSHRVLRWSLAPLLLILLLPLNLALLLCGADPALYGTVLVLQLLFFGCAGWGYYLARRNIKSRLLFVPYYFLFMNLNVLRGASYLYRRRGERTGAWEKARRA